MYKLVVLFSVLALAAAKPNLTPVAYSAALPAVSSVSQYSASVVHGAPSVYAAPSVYSPAVYSPAVYSAPAVYAAPSVYSAPAVVSAVAAPAVVPAVAALAQAPHSPAVVLDAVNGVPLDTPEVVAARAAHFQAKALAGHHLRKRSAVAYSAVPVAHSAVLGSAPVVSAYSAGPVVSAYSTPVVSAYSSPVVSAYSTPVVSAYSSPVIAASPYSYSAVVPRALSVHPW